MRNHLPNVMVIGTLILLIMSGLPTPAITNISNQQETELNQSPMSSKLQPDALSKFGLDVASNYFQQGFAWDITVKGIIGYVANQVGGLQVLDVSDPNNPEILTEIDGIGNVYGVFHTDNYLYASAGSSGLIILSLSDPANPTVVAQYDTQFAWNTVVSNGYAYVADDEDGLKILDVSTPSDPVEVGSYNGGSFTYGVFVKNNYAYVANAYNGLVILDISNPSTPALLDSYYDGGNYDYGSFDVVVNNSYAYVANGRDGLEILDVSSPSSITKVGGYDNSLTVYNVILDNDIVYLSNIDDDGLHVFDVSDPSNPSRLDYMSYGVLSGRTYYGMYLQNSILYTAADYLGTMVVNVTKPSNIYSIAYIGGSSFSEAVEVRDNIAYIGDGADGIKLFDISDPYNPALLGDYDDGSGYINDIAVNGDIVYAMDYYNGLEIYNVSDPAAITKPSSIANVGWAQGLYYNQNKVFYGDDYDGLKIVDVSDPENPTNIESLSDSYTDTQEVVVVNNLVFTAEGQYGFKIINATNPSVVSEIFQDTSNDVYDIAVDGDYLYTIDTLYDLVVWDISNVSAPEQLKTYYSYSGDNIEIEGDLLYVGSNSELTLLDITNPLDIVEKDTINCNCNDAVISSDYIYAAAEKIELAIFEFEYVTSAPRNLDATASEGQVELTWDEPSNLYNSDEHEYKIYRSSDSSPSKTFTTTDTSFVDTTVTNGYDYNYFVVMINEIGESDKSNEVLVTPIGLPAAPRILGLSQDDDDNYIVKWDEPLTDGGKPLTNYNIYLGDSDDFSSMEVHTSVDPDTYEYTFTNIQSQEYYVAITAISDIGESEESGILMFNLTGLVQPDDGDSEESDGLNLNFTGIGYLVIIAIPVLIKFRRQY